ncbi:MAG: hypothetical protein WDW21_03735 [Neisseriaceae bacterium]
MGITTLFLAHTDILTVFIAATQLTTHVLSHSVNILEVIPFRLVPYPTNASAFPAVFLSYLLFLLCLNLFSRLIERK